MYYMLLLSYPGQVKVIAINKVEVCRKSEVLGLLAIDS